MRNFIALQIITLVATMATGPAYAATIGTADYRAAQMDTLGKVGATLQREEVQDQLIAFGVDPQEAYARVAALSPQELQILNQRIDELPAGQDILGLVGAVFVVLLILEVVGVTNVFSAI